MVLPRKGLISSKILLLIYCLASPTFASEAIKIPHIKADIVIDGNLDEAVWQQAKHVDVNIVNYPFENTPSPVKTDAYIFEDGEHLYFAFKAQDPNPQNIQGFIRDRDDAFADDIVGIKLDTFNDHRLAYKFFVNPYGVQNDGIDNEMTGDNSDLWDGIWYADGKVTKDGYQVEFAIPYRELNFAESDDIKTWGIELLRIYPRDNILRISNIELDRDNSCWACQMAEMQGFEDAKIGENLLITPSVVASRAEDRDVSTDEDWQDDNDTDLGLNVRWGITPEVMLNATLNPDFSTIEADARQLTVNKTYALYYDEKRPFFLDNHEYFSSPMDLVYTRNIVDPDYGAKVTGRLDQHSFGFMMAKDQVTNLILPGNIFSLPDQIDAQSYSGAFRYRYDVNQDLSFGLISTLRDGDGYHNFVTGLDTKYRLSVSNTLIAQVLTSDTEYPEDLYNKWCDETQCYLTTLIDNDQDSFSDQALKVNFSHDSEDWLFRAEYKDIGRDFRADLGYLPKVDSNEITTTVGRKFYSYDSWWTDINLGAQYQIIHNDDDELISKKNALSFTISGPWQSLFDIIYNHKEQVGLRVNPNDHAIDGNTTLFEIDNAEIYLALQPRPDVFVEFFTLFGESIDYGNDRPADIVELAPRVVYNVNEHLELDISYTYAELQADDEYVYKENISDFRMTYAFDVHSYLRLTLQYNSTDFNLDNNPDQYIESEEEDTLSTQLIYSYKLNPQTVFFIGYSDNSIDNDQTKSLKQDQRTAFLKLSYAIL